MKNVTIKTEHQESILVLHRMRAQLLKFRHMQTNAIRGLLLEFGQAVPERSPALPGSLIRNLQKNRSPCSDTASLPQDLQMHRLREIMP